MEKVKPAFIVTVHQSAKYRPDGHNYLDRYLTTLEQHMNRPYDVFIMENASEVKYNAPSQYHYHYFPDQNGGMTRAWNMGVNLAVENNNDILCVTNEDIYFNETINNMFEVIDNWETKHDSVFGPVCDAESTFPEQIAKQPTATMKNLTNTHWTIHGWFTAFTRDYYLKYNVDGLMFDPTKIWRGQEAFQQRDWKKGASSYVVGACLVHHEHVGSWKTTIEDIKQG